MRIWVHVPRKLDVEQVTREMIECVTKDQCSKMDNLGALQGKLKEIFEKSKNNILLVLDDLWDDDRIQLDKLLQPLNEVGRTGSKVLITTRMEGVASMLGATNIVPLKDLEDEYCRSIILHYANKHIDELDADQVEILNKIVSKLKKSPLAARVVGNQLGGKKSVSAWSTISKGDVLESTKNTLLWSFKFLPLYLKSCFALCSLYPKGFYFSSMDVDTLVRLWIAQGFVKEPTEAEEDMTIEEKGKQYFNELLSFSFFQRHPHQEGAYEMHDLFHDLAEDVSKGHFFRIEDNKATNIPPTVIHLSIAAGSRLTVPIHDLMKLVNLRTFFILGISHDDLDDIINHGEIMFTGLTKLRFLHFGRFSFEGELNSNIGKLKHLRFLQVYGRGKLTESLGTLYHLQYLYLGFHCNHGTPKSFNNLVKLRHLHPDRVCTDIEDVGKLTSLQHLKVYDGIRIRKYGLQQLEKLQQIRGGLTISGLEYVKDKAEATIAKLKEKRHLEELTLQWYNMGAADVDIDRDEDVFEGLEPHPNLKELEIQNYSGAKLPSWMVDGWLPKLTSLVLLCCHKLTEVPNLPCRLRKLRVEDCSKIESLPDLPSSLISLTMENCSKIESLPNLPSSLESLSIKRCSKVESLPDLPSLLISLTIDDCSKIESLPKLPSSLSSLTIKNCSKIESLSNLPSSLISLAIYNCSKIESVPNLPSSLESLWINEGHPQLKESYQVGGPLRHKIAHITDITDYQKSFL